MTFEEFIRRFLTDRMVRAGEAPEGRELRREVIDGEEVDLFLEDPLIVGEVTAHAEYLRKVDALLRLGICECQGNEIEGVWVIKYRRFDLAERESKVVEKRCEERVASYVRAKCKRTFISL